MAPTQRPRHLGRAHTPVRPRLASRHPQLTRRPPPDCIRSPHDRFPLLPRPATPPPPHRDPHRSGRLHRLRDPRLPRAERAVAAGPGGGEAGHVRRVHGGSGDPAAVVADAAGEPGVRGRAERRARGGDPAGTLRDAGTCDHSERGRAASARRDARAQGARTARHRADRDLHPLSRPVVDAGGPGAGGRGRARSGVSGVRRDPEVGDGDVRRAAGPAGARHGAGRGEGGGDLLRGRDDAPGTAAWPRSPGWPRSTARV